MLMLYCPIGKGGCGQYKVIDEDGSVRYMGHSLPFVPLDATRIMRLCPACEKSLDARPAVSVKPLIQDGITLHPWGR